MSSFPSAIRRLANTAKDNAVSFGLGAVTAFMTTGSLGVVYGLGHLLGVAAGMGGFGAAALGAVGCIIGGGLISTVGLFGLVGGAVMGVGTAATGTKVRGAALAMGIAAGLGGTVYIGHEIGKDVAPTPRIGAIDLTKSFQAAQHQPAATVRPTQPALLRGPA